ncbi:MAG TPA: prepilin-type N-terminal cleavage/methylation domain-containing protein [Tepidisphaeraceae bacterium]|nr:prepilin-type N-terminal cleavage/methylation domain-containing protein [Tepidisphaeraceae bacterium]
MRRRIGFTLVELLVVIGIIALLLAILLPSLNKAKQEASLLWCMSNERQFGTAFSMYAQYNHDRLPIFYWDGTGDPTGTGATDWGWLILPYLKSGSSGTYNGEDPGAIWKLYHDKDTIEGLDTERCQTYGVVTVLFRFEPGPLNASFTLASTSNAQPGPQDDGDKPFKLSQIRRPSDIIMLTDASQIGNQGVPWSSDADVWLIQGSQMQDWWIVNTSQPQYANGLLAYCQTQYPQGPDAGLNKDYESYGDMETDSGPNGALGSDMRYRHLNNTAANALFADGHVGTFHWRRPGYGGTDMQWKNIILDDYRPEDLLFGPGVKVP